ncbi:EamA family transporter [Actinoplanes sp. NPDC048796]|uniref:EamA family transporter n=1 Tax=Actinoplanes sp. NPDC048796 TaxID=3155640 RepID=UPI0033FB168A
MTFAGPLLIVYVVWGSTYLAQKVGLEGVPPLTMNAFRFLVAGALLYGFCRYRRVAPPDRRQWRAGALLGLLLPAAGTGGAAWAEQWLSSGITALFLTGEWSRIDVTGRAALAVGYLIVFGSLVAYTAYTWLVKNAAPQIAGTYAFVNPVVAVLLGWWILDEPLTARTILATAVIAAGVALIVLAPKACPADRVERAVR